MKNCAKVSFFVEPKSLIFLTIKASGIWFYSRFLKFAHKSYLSIKLLALFFDYQGVFILMKIAQFAHSLMNLMIILFNYQGNDVLKNLKYLEIPLVRLDELTVENRKIKLNLVIRLVRNGE